MKRLRAIRATLVALALPAVALPALGGCVAAGPLAAASVGSVVLVQRDPADVLVSLLTGRDCSIVRLASDKSYCKPIDPPLPPPQFCTRSLAYVDCWDRPDPFGYYQRGLADGPTGLTGEQAYRRFAPWPANKLF